MSIEEVEALNPHFKWDWRKQKRKTKSLAKKLIPNVTYVFGCRGHPGIVVRKNYDPHWAHWDLYSADVNIQSLVDGIEESCSIYHCAPWPISREYAIEYAEYSKIHHSLDVWIKYDRGTLDEVRERAEEWLNSGTRYYVLNEQDGCTSRSASVFNLADAEAEVKRLELFIDKGISNPRMVDFLTYPNVPELIDLSNWINS